MIVSLGDKVRHDCDGDVFEGIVDEQFQIGAAPAVRAVTSDGFHFVATEANVVVLAHASLAEQDHADLIDAARLIRGVMDRHNGDLNGPALTAFTQAVLDMRIGERYLDVPR